MGTDSGDARRALAAAAALAALTLVPYLAGGPWREFIPLDDGQYIYQNPEIAAGPTASSLRWAFTTFYQANWHPLTWVSHLLDVSLFGLDPRGHHLTSILLHGLNAALLFAALLRLTGRLGRSWVAAALFALHPLRVESVAWVSERKDVLSGLFFLLTLLAYERYARRGGRGRYALVALALALGLMAKPMLVTLPCVLLLLDFWPLGRGRAGAGAGGRAWQALLLEKAPLAALSLASSVVTFVAQRSGEAVVPLTDSPLPGRLATAAVSCVAYLRLTLWPAGLAVFYPRPVSIPVLRVAAAAAVLALIVFAVLRGARRRPWAFTGWWWFAGMLVPVIGIVQVGEQALADRYTYLPAVGLALAAVWGAPEAARRLRLPAARVGAAAALVLCALAAATAAQAGRWRSAEALLRHTLAVTERNWMAHVNLGALLARQGRWDEAREHYLEVLRLDSVPATVFNNLGSALVEQGRAGEALDLLAEAARIDPGHAGARFNLGLALSRQGRAGEALPEYRRALELALARRDDDGPDPAQIRLGLADALLSLGRSAEAAAQLETAVRERPEAATAHHALGRAYAAAGRHAEAAREYRRSLELEPGSADALNNLGVALMNLGRVPEALESYRAAVRLAPGHAAAHNNLGNALWQAGEWAEALESYRAAIARDPGFAAAYHNLALALEGLGRAGEAAAAREQARLLSEGR